jgi:hypothetical protein
VEVRLVGPLLHRPGRQEKAIKQGIAIDGPDFKAEAGLVTADEIEVAVAELLELGVDALDPGFADEAMDAVQAYISKKERDKVPAEDFGDPENRKYPIRNQGDLDAAVKLIGRAPADKQAAIKARIKKIAKRKGLKLPESWS